MKIKKIEVSNFKAIKEQKLNLDGCSAIITAGNNMGKSSMLSGLIDRFKGEKPDLIVKVGEKKGFYTMELTDGAVIEWNFTGKSERLSYTTKDGLIIKTGVLSQIGEKYFGRSFSIDKFLNAGDKEQYRILSKLVGVDLDEIDARYKEAYADRTEKNKAFKSIAAKAIEKPQAVEKPNVEPLKTKLKQVRESNASLLAKWEDAEEEGQIALNIQNKQEAERIDRENSKKTKLNNQNKALTAKYELLKKFFSESQEYIKFFDFKGADIQYTSQLKEVSPLESFSPKTRTKAEKPAIESTELIEQKIEEAQNDLRKYDSFVSGMKQYDDWVKEGSEARKQAIEADELVRSIDAEKIKIVAEAEMPDGFEFSDGSILYNGFPFSSNQISSSAKYIGALKLAEMSLGEIRTMHFDASTLDKKSLNEVSSWANKKGLQLLIERPDFEGGEIKYDIISK